MNVNRIRQNVLPLIAALIWGTAFVAQSVSTEHVPPFAFNAARSLVAFVAVLLLCIVRRKMGYGGKGFSRELLVSGVCCGTALAVASYFQQKGLATTTPGKAGFITALYIVLVPIAGLLMGKKAPKTLLVGVPLAVAGLYCLCITEEFTVTGGDVLIFVCAFCFTVHILVIDHFSIKVDGVEMSCLQFLVCGVLSSLGAAAAETPTVEGLLLCVWPILYVGVFSSGVAYPLQIIAQKGSNPTVVSLLLSLESVFATLAGALILHDRMSLKEYLGCGLMLAAVVLAQIPEKKTESRQ